MFYVKRMSKEIIEVECAVMTFSETKSSYAYYNIPNQTKLEINRGSFGKVSLDDLEKSSEVPMSDWDKTQLFNVYLPLMEKQRLKEIENQKLTAEEKEKQEKHDLYSKMKSEHSELTRAWWNGRHFDEYGRPSYNTDEVETELENQYNLYSVVTKLELLIKYYGADHEYATEYRANLMKNNQGYREFIEGKNEKAN